MMRMRTVANMTPIVENSNDSTGAVSLLTFSFLASRLVNYRLSGSILPAPITGPLSDGLADLSPVNAVLLSPTNRYEPVFTRETVVKNHFVGFCINTYRHHLSPIVVMPGHAPNTACTGIRQWLPQPHTLPISTNQ